MPQILKNNEVKMNLRVVLTEAEILKRGREIARTGQEKVQLEEDLKEAVASLKAQIASKQADIARLQTEINNGYIFRLVLCRVMMNDPAPGMKTIYRTDSGEQVEAKDMDEHDKQTAMNLDV